VIYAFTGTAGQQASVRVSASILTSGSEQVELLGPDGTSLDSASLALRAGSCRVPAPASSSVPG
jgi:hypothetical protein